jgi:repressor LexA
LLGLRSKSSVAAFIQRMRVAEFLEATPDRRLKPGRRFFQRPQRGSVRAGAPQDADDRYQEPINLDRYLIEQPSACVLIEVQGDSMRDAGILPGDLAVVERGAQALTNDLVVAHVDGEFTLKRLAREGQHFVLVPANPNYAVIRPAGDLSIFGVVRASSGNIHTDGMPIPMHRQILVEFR